MENHLNQARRLVRKLLNDFLIGALALLPVIVVAQIVVFLANLVLKTVFGVNEYVGNAGVTLLAFAAAFGFLASVGRALNRRRHSLVVSSLDFLVGKVPFLGAVYKITQRLIELFRNLPKEAKREIVYVEYPKDGMWTPAYLTHRTGDRCVVFVPTSPNPTNGFTVIVHESRVVPSALNISEATSFVVSLGADFPHEEEALNLAVQPAPQQP